MVWQIITSIVTAAATVGLAIFAGVQIWRERRRQRERERMSEAKISSTAFLLRRQLRSWLGIEPHASNGLETWLRNAQNRSSLAAELDTAEQRITEVANLASEASIDVAANVREAYALFFAGAGCLNEYAATSQPSDSGKRLRWFQLKEDAEKDFRECLEKLEAGALDKTFLELEASIKEKRAAETPWAKTAAIAEGQAAAKVLDGSSSG